MFNFLFRAVSGPGRDHPVQNAGPGAPAVQLSGVQGGGRAQYNHQGSGVNINCLQLFI